MKKSDLIKYDKNSKRQITRSPRDTLRHHVYCALEDPSPILPIKIIKLCIHNSCESIKYYILVNK